MSASSKHIHVGHELEAFSPQMTESRTTASKNEIDDSVEFASAVETQECTSECKTSRRCVPLAATAAASPSALLTQMISYDYVFPNQL